MFNNPFSFNGRIRRTEFGISFIINLIGLFIISASQDRDSGLSFLILGIVPLLWFIWAQSAKRCHDLGNSGWWMIIPFYIFGLLFQDGAIGPNEYGEDPKGRVYEYSSHDTVADGETHSENINNIDDNNV
jgi:uncharacterized membrane protein YhaH (DUF805 family)